MTGRTSADQSELAEARKRIAEPATELAIHRRAAEPAGEAAAGNAPWLLEEIY
ncbi:hypothetical protein [Streptomyces doebereineriae]|uniref:Uncharacterized protein n=1 Tax=Streptomyces doebereineriae TaxID=3075528 RepID=A0ABU2V1E1_9ACTN|nr:hypothetical protein [Streptomyces sp. DSM 41640]MDT0479376.1 hypothetical protein [Streptomyces sp. DSM 41640]